MGAKLGGGSFDDINMTPLIDIVLVVLIIMMVNIPISVNQLGVKLPGNNTAPPPPPNTDIEQLAIAIYEDGKIALNRRVLVEDSSVLVDGGASPEDKDTAMFPLFEQVSRRLVSARKKSVFVDAHPAVNYGIVIDVVDLAKEAGAVDVGFARMKPEGPLPWTSVGAGVLPRGVIQGSPSVVGYITEKKAAERLEPLMPRVRACYEGALAKSPRLTGRMLVRVDVQYQGAVMEAALDRSSLKEPELESCISEVIKEITFQPLDGADEKPTYERTARVVYPLLFSPGS
jgi:biopolymer transport protein ExbD